MLLDWNRLSKDKAKDIESLAALVETYRADLVALLNGGTGIHDNTTSKIITIDCQHGVETPIANPLRVRPKGFAPLTCELLNATDPTNVRALGTYIQPLGSPVLTFDRADGLLGVTVQYAPPLGFLKRTVKALVPTVNGVQLIVPLTTTDFVVGSNVSLPSASRLQCLVSGIVLVNHWTPFDQSLNGYRDGFVVQYNSAGTQISRRAHTANIGGSYSYGAGSESCSVSAGDYFEHNVFQNSGGGVNLNGSAVEPCGFSVQYVAPDPATTARVTGILVGS